MNAEWRWDFAIEILPSMLWATLNTILAAGIGYAIAAIMGLIFLLGQRTPTFLRRYAPACNTSVCPTSK